MASGYDVGDTLATAAPTEITDLGDRFRQSNTRLGDGPFGDRDVDFYVLNALANSRLSAVTSQPFGEEPMSTVLRLFDAGGNELAFDSPQSDHARLEYVFQEHGTYYLGVSGAGNAYYDPHVGGSGSVGLTGNYRLDVSVDIGIDFAVYFGGSDTEILTDSVIAQDKDDQDSYHIYMAGYTRSSDLPHMNNDFQGGDTDGFVVKLRPDGSVVWGTHLGGSNNEYGTNIAIDAENNVYVAGHTYSDDLQLSTNQKPEGANAVYIAKLDADGTLLWTTYFGGSDLTRLSGLALDSDNNFFISGSTRSQDLPGAVNSYHGGNHDHYIAKLSGNDGSLEWSMYLGGSGDEFLNYATRIAIDGDQNIFVTGSTNSLDLEAALNAYPGGVRSGYITKIVENHDNQPSVAWTRYFGGDRDDNLVSIMFGNDGNLLISGATRSTDLPQATNNYLSYSGNSINGFVAKLDSTDGATIWLTYTGGASNSHTTSHVAMDQQNRIFGIGTYSGNDHRWASNAFEPHFLGGIKTLVQLDYETGHASWMIYYGGSDWDVGRRIAIDPDGSILAIGYTYSDDLKAAINTNSGRDDLFLVRLDPDTIPAPPVSPYNDAYSVVSGELLVVDAALGVLANDIVPADMDPASLSVEVVGVPDHGQVQLSSDGSFVYTPPPNYIGNDVFRYRVFDGVRYSRTARVTVNIQPNLTFHSTDTPLDIRDMAGQPRRTDSELEISGTGAQVGALTLNLSITHPRRSDLSADLVGPAGTRVELFNRVNNFPTTYNLSTHFDGEPLDGTWRLEIWDHVRFQTGTLNSWSMTVVPLTQNSAPLAIDDSYSVGWNDVLFVSAPGVLENDLDPDGDPLTAFLVGEPSNGILDFSSDGSFTYTPDPGFFGNDSFTYMANDGQLNSNVATVTITVAAPNLPPVAVQDNYTATWNQVLNVPEAQGVLANDSDPNGDPLSAHLVSGPTAGGLTLNSDGSFSYTPDSGFVGSDSFTYQAFDGEFYSEPALVTIEVVNQAPVAVDDSYATPYQTQLNVSAPGVLANDSDPDGDPLTAVLVSGPSSGSLLLHANGSFEFTPADEFSGDVTFSYQAFNGGLYSNTATVTIVIQPMASEETHVSLDTPKTIQDALPRDRARETQSVLTVSQSETAIAAIGDLTVNVDISHGQPNQLEARLRGPDGTTETLFDRPQSLQSSYQTTLFAGRELVGTWTLLLYDHIRGTVGTLNAWSITVTSASSHGVSGEGEGDGGQLFSQTHSTGQKASRSNAGDWIQGAAITSMFAAPLVDGMAWYEPSMELYQGDGEGGRHVHFSAAVITQRLPTQQSPSSQYSASQFVSGGDQSDRASAVDRLMAAIGGDDSQELLRDQGFLDGSIVGEAVEL